MLSKILTTYRLVINTFINTFINTLLFIFQISDVSDI